MLRLADLRMTHKMMLVIGLSMLGMVCVAWISLEQLHSTMMDDRKTMVRNMVSSAEDVVGRYHSKAVSGELSEEAAKDAALQAIEEIRYAGGNYLWVNDMQPKMLMHPLKPELNGENLGSVEDPEGKALFSEMVAVVESSGGGYVDYLWPKPGFDDPVPKISYVRGFSPWNWVIGTGIYVEDVYAAFKSRLLILSFVILPFLLLSCAMAYWVIRTLKQSLTGLETAAGAIAKGDYSQRLDEARNDEFGAVNRAVEVMRGKLETSAEQAVFNAQIRSAMDGVSTNVMIADKDRKVIYLNRAVQSMLRHVERDLQKDLPHFRADDVLNHSIDRFHKDPSHQMKILENLTSPYTANIVVGGRHFRLQANPVWGEQGERLGTVIEWLDRTAEVAASEEITAIVQAASKGDFTQRVKEEDKDGFFLTMAQGMNQLVQTAEHGLSDVVRVLGEIAEGNLTERIEADYEGTFGQLKTYSNQTADSLSEMMGEIRAASETIATAANEIAQGNTDLSSRTEEQASNLEETASSIEELNSTVKQTTDNAFQANTLSNQATQVAQEGGELVQRVVSTMNDINESAQKIEEIIGVIDSIAFQTNILALNAAVEAARAGDQGRGFAVVASEVRSLAQRSANAAKDIKGLISDSVSKIQGGNQLVNQSGEKTQEIVTAIKRVSNINEEISAASEEQSSGIENINTAVRQMDEMTQQNAALVEEAAAAAESQQSQVESLQHMLTRFKLKEEHRTVGGNQGGDKQLSSSAGTDKVRKPAPASSKSGERSSRNQEADDDWETF